MRLFTNEDLAETTTPEQNEFFKNTYNDYLNGAHEEWLQYEYHHKMLNLVRFMEYAKMAFTFKELSNNEDTLLYEEVSENYEKMSNILVADYNN